MKLWHLINSLKYLVLFSLMLVMLNGCSLFRSQNDPAFNLRKIDIHLDDNANLDSATTIDIVVVYKAELLKELLQMTAAEFNAQVDQLRRDHPKMMKIFRWELTPGQTIQDINICPCRGSIGAVVFANYFTPGDHRIRIGDSKHIHLELKKHDFCIVEQGCGNMLNTSEATPQVTRKQYLMQNQLLPAVDSGNQSGLSSQQSRARDNNEPVTLNPVLARKPTATINDIHNNISDAKKTLDATKSLINELPFK